MATTDEVLQRLKDSRPPETDTFTYLTIIEKSLSPAILPGLREILEDAELTNDIGWDMVEMLIRVPGSEQCLKTIARLGNPREVILKVLEVMEQVTAEDDEAEDGEGAGSAEEISLRSRKFVTLAGMLGILHKRLQVKVPSRFLETTLQTVCSSYNPRSADETAAIIDLVPSLTERKRPMLPTRQSSHMLETPFQESGPSKAAPDPEAGKEDRPDAGEPERMDTLLQAFMATVIESFVDANAMGWAARLLEYTFPDRIVPGQMTMMKAFKEVPELQSRDALMGQLANITSDLGLSKTASTAMEEISPDTIPKRLRGIEVSTDGIVCLTSYRIFATDVFDANYDMPNMYLFPQHQFLLQQFLGEDPQSQITNKPGSAEALIAIAVWLIGQSRITGDSIEVKEGEESVFMSYHHLITLISVFHPDLRVRNAATVLAGHVLHANPDENDRLAILEDLLENCMFSSLQACAVTWLREEMTAARKSGSRGRFADGQCLDKLQYSLFPDLLPLETADTEALVEFWAQNSLFHMQVANFAWLLFGGEQFRDIVPDGMRAVVEHRYVRPLQQAVERLSAERDKGTVPELQAGPFRELDILGDTLARVPLQ